MGGMKVRDPQSYLLSSHLLKASKGLGLCLVGFRVLGLEGVSGRST